MFYEYARGRGVHPQWVQAYISLPPEGTHTHTQWNSIEFGLFRVKRGVKEVLEAQKGRGKERVK